MSVKEGLPAPRQFDNSEKNGNEMVKRLEECNTVCDLTAKFTVSEILKLATENKLQSWFETHFYESQAKKLANVTFNNLSKDEKIVLLCEVLPSLAENSFSNYDWSMVKEVYRRECERKGRERECGKDGVIVTNQAELVHALEDDDVQKVYLYNDAYSIPLHRQGMTYDGRGNAVINIMANDEILDFDGNRIYFYNLTLVFHYLEPHQVKVDHSSKNHNHLIFLKADRLKLEDSVPMHEMESFLLGRTPFESEMKFEERGEDFKGIIIGNVCLDDNDYDMWHEAFFLRPVWKLPFWEAVRRYVRNARLVFHIPCDEAAALYENERALLVYADFSADRDDAVIIRLYLQDNGGQGKVYEIHRLWRETSWGFGSGSGETGYGLDLIDDYEEDKLSAEMYRYT